MINMSPIDHDSLSATHLSMLQFEFSRALPFGHWLSWACSASPPLSLFLLLRTKTKETLTYRRTPDDSPLEFWFQKGYEQGTICLLHEKLIPEPGFFFCNWQAVAVVVSDRRSGTGVVRRQRLCILTSAMHRGLDCLGTSEVESAQQLAQQEAAAATWQAVHDEPQLQSWLQIIYFATLLHFGLFTKYFS